MRVSKSYVTECQLSASITFNNTSVKLHIKILSTLQAQSLQICARTCDLKNSTLVASVNMLLMFQLLAVIQDNCLYSLLLLHIDGERKRLPPDAPLIWSVERWQVLISLSEKWTWSIILHLLLFPLDCLPKHARATHSTTQPAGSRGGKQAFFF